MFVPFLFDKNWQSQDQGVIKNIDNQLMYLKVKKNSNTLIYYKDGIRSKLKIISLITLFFTLIYLILDKYKLFRNNVL